ncbi:hypothetical protein EDC96DRAFT_452126 [Choanephora cucurbitarum]|nr:hypothetical protein EDC96DRAFT_452126 [Choanephora cucurbitarum]
MTFKHFSTKSRVGRESQVYDDDNIRQIAGTIAVDPKTNMVLVISSSKHENVWVLPKGGWENDETVEQSAEREAYEEGRKKRTRRQTRQLQLNLLLSTFRWY